MFLKLLQPKFDSFKHEIDGGDTFLVVREILPTYVILKTRRHMHCPRIAGKFAELKQVLATEYAPNVVYFGKYVPRGERVDFTPQFPKHEDSPKGIVYANPDNYH